MPCATAPSSARIFTELCEQLAGDLQRKGYAGKTIGIKLRFDDFKTVTRDLTLPAHTRTRATIRQRRRPVPEARRPEPPPAPARRARRRAGAPAPTWSRRAPRPTQARAAPPTAREPPGDYSLPLFDDAS